MIIDQRQAIKVLKLNQVFIQRNLNKCMWESYDIGNDYAKHTSTITPGEPNHPVMKMVVINHLNQVVVIWQSRKELKVSDREREKPSEKDVKEWAASESTMNKYRERYKEEWKAYKLTEVVAKMIEKL